MPFRKRKFSKATRTGLWGVLLIIVALFGATWLLLQEPLAGIYNSRFRLFAIIAVFAISSILIIWWCTNKLKLAKEERDRFYGVGEGKMGQVRDDYERISDAFMTLDKNWRVTYINKRASELSKRTSADLLGKNLWEEFPEAVGSITYNAYHKAMAEQQPASNTDYNEPLDLWYENNIYPSPEGLSIFIRDISESKKAEDDLRHSEETQRLIMNSALDAVICMDTNGLITTWTPQAEKVFGWKAEEVIGKTVSETIIPAAYRERHKKGLASYLQTREGKVLGKLTEITAINREGKELPVELTITPVKQGDVEFFCAFVRDISDRKKAEEELRISEARSRRIFDSNMIGLIYWDAKGEILDANDHFLEMVGYTKTDMKEGKLRWNEMTPPEYADLDRKGLEQVALTGICQPYEKEYIRKDGSRISILFGAAVFEGGEQHKGVAYIVDMTERKLAEEKLHKNEIKFRNLVENIHESLIIEDKEGRLVYANSEFGKVFGYTEDEFKNLSYKDYTSPEFYEEVTLRHNSRMKGMQVPEEFEYKGLRKDGSEIWIECRVTALFEEGDIVGTQSLEKDITERKLAEEKIKESETKYRTLMQQAGDSIVLFNAAGQLLDVNESALQLLGYSRHDNIMVSVKDIFFNEDIKEKPLQFDLLNKGVSTITRRRLKRKDGEAVEVEIHASKLSDGRYLAVARDLTVRIKAEQQLRESEEKYRSIVEKNLAGIYQTTIKGRILACNTSFARMLGYTPDLLIGQDAGTLYFIKTCRNKFISSLKEAGELINLETKLKHKDGSPVFVIENCFLQINHLTGEETIEGVMIDVTERKKAEKAIIESEERYRSLVEQASDGIFVANLNGNIIEVNSALCTMFGYTREDALQKSITIFLDPKDTKLKPIRLDLLGKGHSLLVERRAVHKNGNQFDIEISSKLIGEGKVLSIIRDVSERKKAQEQIRLSEEKYRSFFDQSADAIFIFSENGRFLDVNTVSTRLLGYTKEELRNMSLFDIVFKEDLALNPIVLELLATGESVIRQRRIKKKDGTAVEVEVHSKKLPDGKYLGMVRDITERIAADKKVFEKDEQLREISASIPGFVYQFVMEPNGEFHFRYISESAKDLIGVSPEEAYENVGNAFAKVHPDDLPGLYETILASANTLTLWSFTFRIIAEPDKQIKWIQGNSIPKKLKNDSILWNGAMFDLTDLKNAEDEIKRSEEKYRQLFQKSPLPMWVIEIKTKRLIDVNEAAILHYGYSREEFLRIDAWKLQAEKEVNEFNEWLNRNYDDTALQTGVWHHVKKDKSIIDVEVSSHRIIYEDKPCRLIIANDITMRKKAEMELEESYKSIRKLTEYLQNIREEERTYIAREIHDELGQQLTVMMMDVAWLKKKVDMEDAGASKKIHNLLELLDNMVKSVRRISSNLRPSVLDDLGLVPAIEMHLNDFEIRSGILIQFTAPKGNLRLTDQVKNGLFRIFQESLTNVARHSRAKKVLVKLEKKNDDIVLMIEDNGIGYDEKKAVIKRTLGVLGMKERAAVIGGKYQIAGKQGKGTTILVSVPLHK